MPKVFKPYLDKMGNRSIDSFVGEKGELFYDPDGVGIRIGDGITPGGIDLEARWAASAGVLRAYNSNSVVLIGDSRLAQMYASYVTANKVRNAFNFLSYGFARSGQRARIEAMLATSGQRSDQYLSSANQAAALATNALWAIVYGVVNDIAAIAAHEIGEMR